MTWLDAKLCEARAPAGASHIRRRLLQSYSANRRGAALRLCRIFPIFPGNLPNLAPRSPDASA